MFEETIPTEQSPDIEMQNLIASWDQDIQKAKEQWRKQRVKARTEWGPEVQLIMKDHGEYLRVIDSVTQDTPAEKIVEQLDISPDDYDFCVFIMGGAKGMEDEQKRATYEILKTFISKLAIDQKLLLGDGGTDSGVMAMVNQILKDIPDHIQGQDKYIAVSPKSNSRFGNWHGEEGQHTEAIGSEHTHLIPVETVGEIGEHGDWGGETKKMYEVFKLLSKDKKQCGILVNGGQITIDEFFENIDQGRQMIVLNGTGRAADVISRLFKEEQGYEEILPTDPEDVQKQKKEAKRLTEHFQKQINERGITEKQWKSLTHVFTIPAEPTKA